MKDSTMKGTLLTDESCPMCTLYGNVLRKKGTVSDITFQKSCENPISQVDYAKAQNQIAFIDHHERVYYGADALLEVFKDQFPFLTRCFKTGILYGIAKQVYAFISYNRKVISPSKNNNLTPCEPAYSFEYRIVFILLAALFTSLVLNLYCASIWELVGFKSGFGFELMVCFGQIIWQSLIFFKWEMKKKMEYMGNMITVSLIGSLLLIPMLIVHKIVWVDPWIMLAYFGGVVMMMLIFHMRRCAKLRLGLMPTLSWVIYRIFVLLVVFLIINLN
jgi:predicted DCC family thiol-disulfide oxidoreductase YuxK